MSVIATHEARGALVLDISGRITVPDQNLRDVVRQFLDGGRRQFILRMNRVSYIDSYGLAQLVTIYVSIRNAGGTLQLLTPSERVRELLKISRLDTVIEILEDPAPFMNLGAAS